MGLLGSLGGLAGNFFGGPLGGAIGSTLGGVLEGNAASGANQNYANSMKQYGTDAINAMRFRPVGVTTNFTTPNFTYDDKGNLTGASYQLSPQMQAIQSGVMGQAAGQGLDFANMGLSGGQNLFGLGQQFVPASTQYSVDPNAAQYAETLRNLGQGMLPANYDITQQSQDIYNQLEALQQPGREKALSGVRQNLFNTGRGGLATAQGGNLGAANPEMQAYYNAMAQAQGQNALTARNQAQTELTNRINWGTGLMGTALQAGTTADEAAYQRMLSNIQAGSGLMGTGLKLASSGYSPLTAGLGVASNIEQTGQNALDLSNTLGKLNMAGAQAGYQAAQPYYTGGLGTQQKVDAYSPWGTAISGLSGNQQFMSGLGNLFSGAPTRYNDPLTAWFSGTGTGGD